MADLEFFFDPICPWAWITSRWVVEVQGRRDLDVRWRFISLKVLNADVTADWYTPDYRAMHLAGTQALRVAASVRRTEGDERIGALYTAYGERIHPGDRRQDLLDAPVEFCRDALLEVGLSAKHADAALDESFDAELAEESALAISRTGPDVGTPILTYAPGSADEASLFGPVMASIPRGDDAVRLFDAVEVLARSGVSELKRSLRGERCFD
jgi:hypothetical protein